MNPLNAGQMIDWLNARNLTMLTELQDNGTWRVTVYHNQSQEIYSDLCGYELDTILRLSMCLSMDKIGELPIEFL